MIAPASNSDSWPASRGRTAILWTTIGVVAVCFYFIEHRNSLVSSLEAFTVSGEQMTEQAAEGDLGRRVVIPLLGLYGARCCCCPAGIDSGWIQVWAGCC